MFFTYIPADNIARANRHGARHHQWTELVLDDSTLRERTWIRSAYRIMRANGINSTQTRSILWDAAVKLGARMGDHDVLAERREAAV